MKQKWVDFEEIREVAPSVDIEPGNLFTWTGERRSAIHITTVPWDMPTVVHDGLFYCANRPRHWWHLRTWFHVARVLWGMPYEPGLGGSAFRRSIPEADA